MSDTRDTLPTGGESYPATTSPNTYSTTPDGATVTTRAGSSASGTGGGMDTAKEEAANVAGTAKDEAKHVAQTAKHEAKQVGREARTQASRLYHQARTELSDQASHQQERLAGGLRSASGELRGMADSSTNGGVATDLVRQASDRLDGVASWLGARDPRGVLDEVSRYARRRPLVFIGVAALAGVLVGRLTRSLAQGSPDDDQDWSSRGLTASSGPGLAPDTELTYDGYGTGGAYAADAPVYGDTPVYDASTAGRSGAGAMGGDDVLADDPLYGSEDRP